MFFSVSTSVARTCVAHHPRPCAGSATAPRRRTALHWRWA